MARGYLWHVPAGGKRLAFAELCQNQTLKYGRNIYWHPVSRRDNEGYDSQWSDAYKGELESTLKGVKSPTSKRCLKITAG